MPFIVTAEEAEHFVLSTADQPMLSVNTDFFLSAYIFRQFFFK